MITMFFYTIYEIAQMNANSDYTTQLIVEEDFYSQNDRLRTDEIGFSVAAGLIGYGLGSVEDPTYGELQILRKYWNVKID